MQRDNRILRFDSEELTSRLSTTALAPAANRIVDAVNHYTANHKHGELPQWQAAIENLPELAVSTINLQQRAITVVGTPQDDPSTFFCKIKACMQCLHPWRKGPYQIQSLHIDTEWRSDWKWLRLAPHISPLKERTVLDVGCGSGYHLWRMRGAGARNVIGIEPGLLFNMQFRAIQHFINDPHVQCLPLTMESWPTALHAFDSVFSMGVLYHRREPAEHLAQLRAALRAQGELILETLVFPHVDDCALDLEPQEGRYARMRNLWCLPSPGRLHRWLVEAGFINIRCVSIDCTSTGEQRTTDWMRFESLQAALGPDQPTLTTEGLPRPQRAVFVAVAP